MVCFPSTFLIREFWKVPKKQGNSLPVLYFHIVCLLSWILPLTWGVAKPPCSGLRRAVVCGGDTSPPSCAHPTWGSPPSLAHHCCHLPLVHPAVDLHCCQHRECAVPGHMGKHYASNPVEVSTPQPPLQPEQQDFCLQHWSQCFNAVGIWEGVRVGILVTHRSWDFLETVNKLTAWRSTVVPLDSLLCY